MEAKTKPTPDDMPKLKPGAGLYLALGGGAARGLAHLGVLRALEENDIPIAGICGTSMGAVVGAAYALCPRAEQITRDFRAYLYSTHFTKARYAFMRQYGKKEKRGQGLRHKLNQSFLLGRSLATGAVIDFDSFCSEIYSLVPDRNFSRCKIPFFATAVDLFSFKEVIFHTGNLRPAVLASSAIPGVFPAVKAGDALYVDGGWMNKIPVSPMRHFGADHVIGVDVTDRPKPEINPKRGFSVLSQTHQAAQVRLHELQTQDAAYLWTPPVDHIHWADFTRMDEIVEAGYTYAKARIHAVRALLEPPGLTRWQRLRNRLCLHEPPSLPTPTFSLRGIWEAYEADDL